MNSALRYVSSTIAVLIQVIVRRINTFLYLWCVAGCSNIAAAEWFSSYWFTALASFNLSLSLSQSLAPSLYHFFSFPLLPPLQTIEMASWPFAYCAFEILSLPYSLFLSCLPGMVTIPNGAGDVNDSSLQVNSQSKSVGQLQLFDVHY